MLEENITTAVSGQILLHHHHHRCRHHHLHHHPHIFHAHHFCNHLVIFGFLFFIRAVVSFPPAFIVFFYLYSLPFLILWLHHIYFRNTPQYTEKDQRHDRCVQLISINQTSKGPVKTLISSVRPSVRS